MSFVVSFVYFSDMISDLFGVLLEMFFRALLIRRFVCAEIGL